MNTVLRGSCAVAVIAWTWVCTAAEAQAAPAVAMQAQGPVQDHPAASPSASPAAPAAAAPAPAESTPEIIVTAQKRSQNINNVGMSITAISGDALRREGVLDTAELTRVVPGFNFTETAFATPVYTIRGVGFQDSTLAASPAVSVYVDEIPVPFPIETESASLDLERVEVLKGPQGTLFGENSTGGAVNYIAAKPTNHLTAGVDASYGRFDTTDVMGFVSGPVTDTLNVRLSGRALESGNWQKSYTSSDTLGAKNLLEGRLLLDWRPIERLKVSVNLNISDDRSDSPAAQLIGVAASSRSNPLFPAFANYPLAPHDDQAAGWDPGKRYRRNNIFYQASTREDYDLGRGVTATAITAYQRFTRNQPIDADGTPYNDIRQDQTGSIDTVYQELRLSGRLPHQGDWIVGANYESDGTTDYARLSFPVATTRVIFGVPATNAVSQSQQNIKTYAVYGNFDYDILPNLTLQGGLRFTQANREFSGCSQDAGDGSLARVFTVLQRALKGANGTIVPIAPGGCVTLNAAFNPALVVSSLDENNVSWRTGLNWKARPWLLIYGNVSRGYKAGSFPTLSASSFVQFTPVKQESLMAYEAGFKATLLDRTLQLSGSGYYYDYSNKQIRGSLPDPIYGALEALVNVPDAHVDGFELSADWRPIPGLTLSPAVTLVDTRIDGNFFNYTPLSQRVLLTGESFPYTPRWQAYLNGEYRWGVSDRFDAYIGGNLTYQSATNGAFGDLPIFRIKSYELLGLRAGLQTKSGAYRAELYGENVTNTYYWTSAQRRVDALTRYAGMPATYGVRLSYRYN